MSYDEATIRRLVADLAALRGRVEELETLETPAGIDPPGHDHAKLVASDGDPDPCLSADASGNLTVVDGAWIGADSDCSWVYDSSNGDVTTQDKVGIGTDSPLAKYHQQGTAIGLGDTEQIDASDTLMLVEGTDAFLELVADDNGTWACGVVLSELSSGSLTDKWGIIRQTSGTGDSGLYFTYGSSRNPWANSIKVAFDSAGNVWIANDCSALSFTDRSPVYVGDALALLREIQPKLGGTGDWQELDHDTLPARLQKGAEEERGRDLGANIQLNSRAICQLAARLEALEQPRLEPK